MKKPALVVIETVIAVAAVLLLAGLVFAYRGALADTFNRLRGQSKPVAVVSPSPTPIITPLPQTTFQPKQDGSIAQITPTPRLVVDKNGYPLPSSGPEDIIWLIGLTALVGSGIAYGVSLKRQLQNGGSQTDMD